MPPTDPQPTNDEPVDVKQVLAPGVLTWSEDRVFVEDHCANCVRELPADVSGLFCSPWCKETASNVRYFRRVFRDGRAEDPDVREAISTRLAFLTAGGYAALGRTLSPSTRSQVIDRDQGKCVSCGQPGNEIDHIDGSSPDLTNLQLLCHRCHASKTAAAMVPASETHRALVEGLMIDRVMPEQPRLSADDDQSWPTTWRQLTAERKERLRDPDAEPTARPSTAASARRSPTTPRARTQHETRPGTMPPMPTSVHDVLDQLRAVATSEADKGARFEQLMVAFLKADPTYAEQFSDVFAWQDWPGRNGKHDTGIDLVAIDRQTGGNVAIQCKFYAAGHHVSKPDIDSFLAASGTTGFTRRIIISTGADWGPHAEAALAEQTIPITRIGMGDLAASRVDWSQFTWSTPDVVATRGKKTARPHQRTAIDKVTAGLAERGRGKLIMACGTGKTFTSLRLAEEHVGAGGTVLFLVPSISLLSQTVREWASESDLPLQMLAVCSDPKATKRTGTIAEDISAVDLALPATTDLDLLTTRWSAAAGDTASMTVVFSTYQSIEVVAAAQAAGGFDPFDLIICDEAHRTTGVTIAGVDESAFVRVHDNTFLPAEARLYMTATPRLFGDDSKKKAKDADAVIASMDDEDTYGPELHRLGFGEAVEKKLLTDYRVLVLAVDEEYVTGNFQQELATSGEIPLGDAARIVGCWNGLAKHFDTTADETDHPMRRAVAFAKNINASKVVAASFPALVDRHIQTLDLDDTPDEPRAEGRDVGLRVECEHVDGTYNALQRNERLDWLRADSPDGVCRVLTNVRCLSEGVDVPSLDAVMFLTPRDSEVDVVQSVGRVMRISPGKDYGYIILPVAVPSGIPPEVALRDNEKYKVVWQVLQALRAHDDRFNATINQIDLNTHRPDKIRIIGVTGPDGSPSATNSTAVQTALKFDLGAWQDGIYAKIVAKVGERRYWETWAGDVALIAQQLTTRITGILATPDTATGAEFEKFLDGLRGNLNDAITAEDAVEMLAQHLITRPIFQSFFGAYDFTGSNPVARIMETMLDALDEHALDTETTSLDRFYASVALRLDDIDNATGRQRILVELYDKFFAKAFKRRVDKLGIVYTPIEITDFILRSADELLREHFGQGLTDEGVHILDGFTGTGTFIVRLLQLDLIRPEDLVRKYAHEIHANEILLLAYYIAAVNIESTYLDARRAQVAPDQADTVTYEPFPGLVLTDTFQSYEEGDRLDEQVFIKNNERLTRQKNLPITVIVGNPPYSAGQDSANDNNANDTYAGLDASIRATYAARSTATLKNKLYDSYIRAIRWATLRLIDRGIIAFVTNGGWLDSNTADGMRQTLAEEFSDIHIYNLRGNQRTAGEQSRKEGGKVFGGGSRATVAITLLVRDPTRTGPARVHYTDIGDYLTREQKLATIATAGSMTGIETETITPNDSGDWLNQRNEEIIRYPSIDDIFGRRTHGINSGRDAWVTGSSRVSVVRAMQRATETYRQETSAIANGSKPTGNSKQISWSRAVLANATRGRSAPPARDEAAVHSMYRPFFRQWTYLDPFWLSAPGDAFGLFPSGLKNELIYIVGLNSAVPFSTLASNEVVNLHFTGAGSGGAVFARWRYEKVRSYDGTLGFETSSREVEVIEGYQRTDNITDTAHVLFAGAYGERISKDDIFFYIYGLLHSPDYRAAYAADLKKTLPRIPLVTDPWPYISAGRALSKLHLGYETVAAYPIGGLKPPHAPDGDLAYDYYRVQKMAFAKTRDPKTKKLVADKSTVVYNGHITVTGIPDDAHRYMLGSRSAIEWIIDRYHVKQDKASGIVNDPNDWSREVGKPRYILDLLARIVTVSLETMKIVDALPALDIRSEK